MGLSDVIRYLNSKKYKCYFDNLEVFDDYHQINLKSLLPKYKKLNKSDIEYLERELSYRYSVKLVRTFLGIKLWEVDIKGGYYY